jgi:hypothetical protein
VSILGSVPATHKEGARSPEDPFHLPFWRPCRAPTYAHVLRSARSWQLVAMILVHRNVRQRRAGHAIHVHHETFTIATTLGVC